MAATGLLLRFNLQPIQLLDNLGQVRLLLDPPGIGTIGSDDSLDLPPIALAGRNQLFGMGALSGCAAWRRKLYWVPSPIQTRLEKLHDFVRCQLVLTSIHNYAGHWFLHHKVAQG